MGVGTSTFVIRWINFLTVVAMPSLLCGGFRFSKIYAGFISLPDLVSASSINCCGSIWGVAEHPSRRLSKVPYSPCLRTRWHHLSNVNCIYNRVLRRFKEQRYTVMGLSDHVVLRIGGNSGIHGIGICSFRSANCWFIVTNNGSGHNVPGLRQEYKEYELKDYSSWFLKQLNNTRNWKHLKTCLVKSDDCNNLSKKYKTLKQYKSAKLTPIEAGCCRPPSECGYPAVNASYYDLSFHPISSNEDCKLYKNSRTVKCYSCDSCKAGVAQYMKTEWRVVAIFNVVLFLILSMIYFVGCCARRNAAARSQSKA
ncbi:hypothetical protein FEM48_Zijuj11G0038500 [Ziziphus jujuba var. spinosa]|uniref:Tetraspanin-10 n=1 Tax=Ziziphus jujuba var. spinosa TaxID=714518 RepID=A0A978UGN2_ZIZJJ|nr:hypothetical protein FEM48_Zijuj11G0038500 [Ziziphus jujuba var. spinosa]